jgi:hypothetical protein
MRHVRRIADDEVERRKLDRARPRPQVHIHIHARTHRVHPCTSHGTGTDVERGDRRGALRSGGDRHHTAAGAQVGDPAPNGHPVFSRTSMSTRESSWGAYTPCAAITTSRSSVYAVDTSAFRQGFAVI